MDPVVEVPAVTVAPRVVPPVVPPVVLVVEPSTPAGASGTSEDPDHTAGLLPVWPSSGSVLSPVLDPV